MIKANKEKCIKCHKCIEICPFTVLRADSDGIPESAEGKICIKCMHCASTCPTDALTFDDKEAIIQKPVRKLPESFAGDLESHIIQRRSYRHFKDEPVDKNIIMEVLDTARWTPSAKNQHPTKYIVVNSKKVINEMMAAILEFVGETGMSPEVATEYAEGNNVVMGEAPTILIAYARDNAINPPGDTYIAMSSIELLLQSKGIGTCWCGYLTRFLNNVPKLKEILPQLPDGNSFYASFMVGYPENEEYIHIPERLKKADIKWVE